MTDVPALVAAARSLLDIALATACEAEIQDAGATWSAYEVDRALDDMEQLERGGDCCYDRPSAGVTYALWYHGKRAHGALRYLMPLLADDPRPVRIIDLGCGTGATASAVRIAMSVLAQRGAVRPESIDVEGVDSSVFMAATARRIDADLAALISDETVQARFSASRWEDLPPATDERTLLYAGFLFDASDDDHVAEIAERLLDLGDKVNATQLVMTTTRGKGRLITQIQRGLANHDWTPGRAQVEPWFGDGRLTATGRVRREWYARQKVERDGGRLNVGPYWTDKPGDAKHTEALVAARAAAPSGATLFVDERFRALLDERQRAAATPDQRLTVVSGAAGSGKTLVLASRIANQLAATEPRDGDPRILATAFNKAVVDLLYRETLRALEARNGVRLLQHRQVEEGRASIDVAIAGRPGVVTFLNRDRLPVRVLGVERFEELGEWHSSVDLAKQTLPPAERALIGATSAEEVAREFEAVILGRGCLTELEYLAAQPRVGPRVEPPLRPLVWRLTTNPPIRHWLSQRYAAYVKHAAAVRSGSRLELKRDWSHVFVDECQDFTPAEIELLARIPHGPQQLCIAGDPAQAVSLGKAYRRPRRIAGADWKPHLLEGSYRLPLRVVHALQPLSVGESGDDDQGKLTARKRAVLGVRPVIVSASSLKQQLPDILYAYAALGERRIFVADAPRWLEDRVRGAADGWSADCGSVLKWKGCEWPFVLVSDARSRTRAGGSSEAGEQLYTGLTRTTGLLIVALARPSYADAATTAQLGRLEPDRLLFWDAEAEALHAHARRVGASRPVPVAGDVS